MPTRIEQVKPLLAGAALTLAQGPYSPAPPGEAPADAPTWIAGHKLEEHVFRVTAEFECPAEAAGGIVQVSISDTMVRAEFTAEDAMRRQVLTLRIPEKQLQGLKPELFCPRTPAEAPQVQRLASRFTAQGALICRTETGSKATATASLAMDAWVLCPAAAPNPPNDA
ncbi:hypothetical protein [Candidatus Foliamicus sp.]